MDRPSSSEPEEEQQNSRDDESLSCEPGQETPEAGTCPTSLALIELRRQQLNNRHVILLKMQQFWKKSGEHSSRAKGEGSSEDAEQPCELEAIQMELEELRVKEEELQQQEGRPDRGREGTHSPSYKVDHVTPYGGIYLLPPPAAEEEVTSELGPKPRTEPGQEKPLTPVVSLALTPAVTQCPSCFEVITTETHSKVGGAMWLLCCMSSMLGCVAGCCLIPFFIDNLRDVHHQCPMCHSHIHTRERL
ncbi:cell death-inducing p53-target protein 1 homolog [Centroberyx affinis]|uniref:cell death-inducing p53-target protein 1 homolog n=1 Tax=Centroberyx affinis TaxID=166261 RepID=UPI003A5C4762